MSATTADEARCTSCGARLGATAGWCSLCMAPVPVAQEPVPVVEAPVPVVQDPVADGATTMSQDPVARGDDPVQLGDDEPVRVADDPVTSADAEAERMLARLREEAAGARPLARGPLAGRSRGVLLLVGLAAAVAVTALLAGAAGVLGMLL